MEKISNIYGCASWLNLHSIPHIGGHMSSRSKFQVERFKLVAYSVAQTDGHSNPDRGIVSSLLIVFLLFQSDSLTFPNAFTLLGSAFFGFQVELRGSISYPIRMLTSAKISRVGTALREILQAARPQG